MKTFYSHLEDWPTGGMVRLFEQGYGLQQVKSPQDADIIIWNGGEDIGSSIYGEEPVMKGIPLSPSARDTQEIEMFKRYSGNPNKLLVGICRGAQLLNCLNGGTLWQDVNNHGSSHPMVDLRTGEVLQVTSTHHQMMRPNLTTGEIIGVANVSTYKNAADGVVHITRPKNIRDGDDVEVVWYKPTHTLCIQGHPEYVPNSRFAQYCHELIDDCWKSTVQRKRNAAFA